MGNRIGALFVQSLRRSLSGTTVFSQTSANKPLFVDPTSLPGVARAWVSFNGYQPAGAQCQILNKSTNITGVTSQGFGDYKIGVAAGTFVNNNYLVTGSITSRERVDLTSAANNFFVMDTGYKAGVTLTNTEFRIQTIYSTASAGAVFSGPAYAKTVNLVIFK